jgi:hypothetical protein
MSELMVTEAVSPLSAPTVICTPSRFSDCTGDLDASDRSRIRYAMPPRTSWMSTVSPGIPALQPVRRRNSTV